MIYFPHPLRQTMLYSSKNLTRIEWFFSSGKLGKFPSFIAFHRFCFTPVARGQISRELKFVYLDGSTICTWSFHLELIVKRGKTFLLSIVLMINSNDNSVGPSRSLSRIRNEAIREFHTGLFNFTNCEYTLIIYSLS